MAQSLVNAEAGRGPRRPSRRWKTSMFLAAAGLVGLAFGNRFVPNSFRAARSDLVTHRVHRERLELTIVERGTLESSRNSDIYCTVKAGARNSTVASTIKWLIEDGALVRKGDPLVELDDSGLRQQLKAQKIIVNNAAADRVKAEEEYKIQISQNRSDIQTHEVNLRLARIDLKKYREGEFPQQLKELLGKIRQAESDLDQQQDRVAWARRMAKKGYLTGGQAQAEQTRLDGCRLNLGNLLEQQRVLTDPEFGTRKRQETDLENKVSEAQQALERVQGQARAKEIQTRSARDIRVAVHEEELAQLHEIEKEIAKCKIHAQQDGLVVHCVPDQARLGGGSQQAIIAQGEPVREGQKLMQIPDLRHMRVNTKVHEALVARVQPGQPALVRVDAFPDRILHGQVEAVATLSSQPDWLSSDVKVYTTQVRIDESVSGLKPGMSAEVTIVLGDPLDQVLTVPIQAILGSPKMGKQRRCAVRTSNGAEQRTVVVGQSNAMMAEIKEGLREEDEVILNPRAVLGDPSSAQASPAEPTPSTQPK